MTLPDEPPTPEEAHHFLKDDNERRCQELKERTEGKIQLDGAFTMMRIETYLKHLLLDNGILDRADLDYEGQRSTMLDKIEAEVTEHEEKMQRALAQAKLMGNTRGFVEGTAGPRIFKPNA
jgi:hypothetical protein